MVDIKKELETKGYVVIPNVISKEQVTIAKKLFKEWQATIPNHDKLHTKIDPHGIYKHHYVTKCHLNTVGEHMRSTVAENARDNLGERR